MNLNHIYEGSLLSQAVYANDLNQAISSELLTAQLIADENGAGMSQSQAEHFASRFRVVMHDCFSNNPF